MDLRVTYLGLSLPHPFMAGASPLGADLDSARRLEDGGCAASGRIRHMDPLDPQFAALLQSFPGSEQYPQSPAQYVEHIRRLKSAVRIPIIASLNGTTDESWLNVARQIEDAGADALELNMYEVETDLNTPSTAVEHRIQHVVTELKSQLRLPIAVKLSPFFTAFGNMAKRLDHAGADGLVIFNRFYQPDIDVRAVAVTPTIELSTSAELRLRLRWLAVLHGQVKASLAVTGGVVTPDDGVKAVLAGAHAVQMVSGVLRHGAGYFGVMRAALGHWLDIHSADSLDEVRGRLSLAHAADRDTFERANYIRTLQSFQSGGEPAGPGAEGRR